MADKREKVFSTDLVNSKKKQLPTYEVLLRRIASITGKDAPPDEIQKDVGEVVYKMQNENVVTEQIGNTVFMHRVEEANGKKVAQGTVFNLDIAPNMKKNMEKYMRMLRAAGVDHWVVGLSPFAKNAYLPMAKAVIKKLAPEGYRAKIVKSKKQRGVFFFVFRISEGAANGQ